MPLPAFNDLVVRFTAGVRALYRPLGISLISLLLLYWPLLDVRYYFLDDVGRTLDGYTGYRSSGRPLADIFFELATLGQPLTDIAPAPQLVAVLLLALTTALLASKFEITSPVSLAAFSVAVGGSPYFLENMSFRFDSGPMALGVLCSIAPFFERPGKSTLAISSVFLFASLCLYQPTINCYPVIALCLTAHSLVIKSVRESLAKGLLFAVPLGLAVVAYWTLYKVLPSSRAQLLAQQGQFVPPNSAFSAALAHLNMYASTVFDHWASTSLGMIWSTMAVVTGIILVVRIATSYGRTVAAKVATAALGIMLLLLTFPAAFLSLLFLATPVLASRTLVGFLALIAGFSGLLLLWTRGGKIGFLTQGLVVLQAIGFVGVAYTYANSLRMQERYDDLITAAIVHDIMEMRPAGEVRTFVISGWLGRAPMVENNVAKYPALATSVFTVIGEDSYWARFRFRTFGLFVKPAPPGTLDTHDLICRGTPRKSNQHYELYLVDHTVFIRFKSDGVKCSQ
jgi:hypothetical protein